MKQLVKRFRRQIIVALILIPAVAYFWIRYYSLPPSISSILWIVGTADPPGELEEVLTVPVNTDKAVLTIRKYAGWVTIVVRGEGILNSDTKYDALYWYSETETKGGRFWGFRLDDDPIDYTRVRYGSLPHGLLPDMNNSHEYKFMYWVGDDLRPLAFQITNENTQDTAIFTITISLVNSMDAPGR